MNQPSTPGPVHPAYETAVTPSGVKWLVVESPNHHWAIWRSEGVHQQYDSIAPTLAAARKRADDKFLFAMTFGKKS